MISFIVVTGKYIAIKITINTSSQRDEEILQNIIGPRRFGDVLGFLKFLQ